MVPQTLPRTLLAVPSAATAPLQLNPNAVPFQPTTTKKNNSNAFGVEEAAVAAKEGVGRGSEVRVMLLNELDAAA